MSVPYQPLEKVQIPQHGRTEVFEDSDIILMPQVADAVIEAVLPIQRP